MNRREFRTWAKEQCIADGDAERIWSIASEKCEPSESMIETATAFVICEHIEIVRGGVETHIVEQVFRNGGVFKVGCADDAEVMQRVTTVAFGEELAELEFIRGTLANGLVVTFSLSEETTPYTVICKIKDKNGEFTMTLRDFQMKR